MFPKTMIALSAAIALATASGAFAQAKKPNQRDTGLSGFAQSVPQQKQNNPSSRAVITDGKVIGRDPDPNVRFQLRRDYQFRW